MYAILIATATAVAFAIARRTRGLVETATRAALVGAQASRGLHRVLRDHHDLRSAISSAQLNADLVAIGASDAFGHLQADLTELRGQLEQVKARALAEVAKVEGLAPASISRAVGDVLAAMHTRYPAVTIASSGEVEAEVLVAGGDVTLRRIVTNLVLNACEGDGRSAAHSVRVSSRRTGDRVALEVVDDGPGFPPHVLEATPGAAFSTKLEGTGLGIGLVDSLVRASGGSVSWRNREGGGALVAIELRAST
jgi:C4-dicarboxylate-specific signal transduction histidine kinase